MGMVEETHPDYDFYQLFSEPEHLGFGGLARYRTWVIGAHQERTACLHDPFELQEVLTQNFCSQPQAKVSDFLVASRAEILQEAFDMSQKRSLYYFPEDLDLNYFLNKREVSTKKSLDEAYLARFQQLPSQNKDLVYFLGDSAGYCSWSAVSGKIPTYRLNSASGTFWLPAWNRWLTSKERLVSMSFPVTNEMSEAMDTPLLGASDVKRASDLCGNSMHFTSAAAMQLIALTCFGPWV